MAKVISQPRKVVVDFSPDKVHAMKSLLNASAFPSRAPMKAGAWELGMEYEFLVKLLQRFQGGWSWDNLKSEINRYEHFIAGFDLEGKIFDIHYLYARCQREDAIPLLLLHGWPGTFYDFHKVIKPLTNPQSENEPAFHVIVPSLPGFFLSTFPEEGCTLVHTAAVFDSLMVSVLGFSKYAVQGGDWGSWIARILGNLHPEHVPAIHCNMFRLPVPISGYDNLTEREKQSLDRREHFLKFGRGYYAIQSTKPFSIGMAVASSPLSMLVYIGEKFHEWSDPRYLQLDDILDTVALYFLSDSFPTSVLVYHQSGPLTMEMIEPGKWPIKSNIGFSNFPYEIGASPRAHIALVGEVVFYKEHEKGGHFPALDAADEFVEDVRQFFKVHFSLEDKSSQHL